MKRSEEELRLALKALADKTISADNDDFMVDDYAGGNIDDAYDLGSRHGEVQLARELFAQFFE